MISGRGGQNKKPAWRKRLEGTFRPDRTKPTKTTPSAAARLRRLEGIYAFHSAILGQLHTSLNGFIDTKANSAPVDTSRLLRESRHQVLLLLQLGAGIGRLEQEIGDANPAAELDGFEEFQ